MEPGERSPRMFFHPRVLFMMMVLLVRVVVLFFVEQIGASS
jgi:hypothetical protein